MRFAKAFLVISLIMLTVFMMAIPAFAVNSYNNGVNAPNMLLIKFHDGIDKSIQKKIHSKCKGEVVEELSSVGIQKIRIKNGKLQQRMQEYLKNPEVKYAEPDYVAQASLIPNDPLFYNQWNLESIQAPASWDVTTGNPQVRIAILDTGIALDHPDLKNKVLFGVNYTNSYTAADLYGHGTHVAGIAAAATNNNIGVAGTSFNCRLINAKVLGDDGSGYYSWIAKGIVWATNNGAKVINMSLGSPYSSQAMQDAVNYAWSHGVVIVAAAGNESSSNPSYPAALNNVIAVAAIDTSDNLANFSNYGSWVDISAPGVDIFSTLPGYNNALRRDLGLPLSYGTLSGTSMAAPHVSGATALIWSTSLGSSNSAVRDRLIYTADQSGSVFYDYDIPRLNVSAAVE